MLRGVGKKVSGALAGPRDETGEPALDSVDPPRTGDTDPADTSPTDSSPAPDVPARDVPARDVPARDVPARDVPARDVQEDPIAETAPAELQGDVQPDRLCAAAVDLARTAAVEVAGPAVGEHLGVEVDDERVVTHSFATTEPAYVGWRWAVTVARADGSDAVTIDDVVLLPGSGALLAPAWVPWSERVQPDDLSPGDLLPPPSDDPRLVPAYADVDAEPLPFDLHRELGLGRPRVLSLDGRADAAERWYDGPAGPDTPMAKAAPGRCADCGFLVHLAGSLGRVFGACANAMAPDDGRVVALQHGCGAHSETVVEAVESTYAGMAVEDDEFEVVDRSELLAEELATTDEADAVLVESDAT
jgi:hypothetical protein